MKTVSLLILLILHTTVLAVTVSSNKTTSYNAAELLSKIFNPNITVESRQRGYGFVKFEDQDLGNSDTQDFGQYGLIDSERDERPLRFEGDYDNQNYNIDNHDQYNDNKPFKFEDGHLANNGGVFQDDNNIEEGTKKKRRKRRRKPKNGVLPYLGGNREPLGRPGFQDASYGGFNPYAYGNPGYPAAGPIRRPRRPRPKPSLATEALSSITGALTSIALYDDYQCVPRLLCEAAGGGSLSDNGVLQSIAGIQPLLTLLSAYNGISSSPLFVFGRAVFLGMTSKGNTGTCRYAYPQCPTDPEQLIHYLNNHNGGFFRFFNAPQLQNQNLEQFYNQLSQGYPNQPNPGQNGYQDPNYDFYPHQQHTRPYDSQDQGSLNPYNQPGLYENQNYGPNYAYDYNYDSGNRIRFKDNDVKIENRIQNKPTQNYADDSFEVDDVKTKWQFPDDLSVNENKNVYNIRGDRKLTFPEDYYSNNDQNDSNRKGKQVYFPQYQNNQNYYNDRPHIFSNNNRYETTTYSYNNGQNNQNYYSTQASYTNNNNYHKPTRYHNYDYNPNNNNNGNYYNNNQNNNNYYKPQNNYNNNNKYPTTVYNNDEYVFDQKHNFYVKKENKREYPNYNNNNVINNYYKRQQDDGLNTVYVVRGNGDPTQPEIVKLRPGQSVY